jgi:small subunit ribosomal protein S6
MRRYELMLLIRPDLEDDKLQAAVERVTRTIVNAGGSLAKVSPWGKRRLAYNVQNFREASYFLIHFDIQPAAVREIERSLLISEEILRHLVTLIGAGAERRAEEEQVAGAPPEAVIVAPEAVIVAPEAIEEQEATDEEIPAAVEEEAAASR